tara:strand:+ start:183 stop:332 length:150 start_codon:yes stop_codon:yes gene_type:complete
MKNIVLIVLISMFAFASCGGGGSTSTTSTPGNTPTGNISGQVEIVESTN